MTVKHRVIIFAVCVLLDAFTKMVSVLHGVSVSNAGAAFSLGAGTVVPPWVFSGLGVLAMVLAAVYLPRARSGVGIVLMAAGIMGNLIDRIVYGHVTDWLKIMFVTCNLADLFICVGGALMMLSVSRSDGGPTVR